MFDISKIKDKEGRKKVIKDFIKKQGKVSSRQIFYHLVATGWVKKDDNGYKYYTNKLVNDMRLAGEIPMDSLTDSTSLYYTYQYDNFDDMVDQLKINYCSSWDYEFEHYVEVWLEKESLADIVYGVTNWFGVKLSVSSGRTKISQVYSAVQRFNQFEVPVTILYLGDFDPTGMNISENLREQFINQYKFMISEELPTIERIAITEEQSKDLPASYRKANQNDKNYDSFVVRFGEYVWDLDVYTPEQLGNIVYKALVEFRPVDKIKELRARDKEELDKYKK